MRYFIIVANTVETKNRKGVITRTEKFHMADTQAMFRSLDNAISAFDKFRTDNPDEIVELVADSCFSDREVEHLLHYEDGETSREVVSVLTNDSRDVVDVLDLYKGKTNGMLGKITKDKKGRVVILPIDWSRKGVGKGYCWNRISSASKL